MTNYHFLELKYKMNVTSPDSINKFGPKLGKMLKVITEAVRATPSAYTII